MLDSAKKPWSNNRNAPQIPYLLYISEKEVFSGGLLGAASYGIVIALFFQCIHALLNPINRAGQGIRWGFVTYTVAMFLFVTVFNALYLDIPSLCYIDNRDFLGNYAAPPGPLGYFLTLYSKPIYIVANTMFLLNSTLADGLLLYRCYVIYSRNYWAIAFPFLMYLVSIAMGIVTAHRLSQPYSIVQDGNVVFDLGLSFFSVSFSLNVALTLMIVIRLFLYNREIRKATGTSGRLYTAVFTMLVESQALYAVSLLLYVVPWVERKDIQDIFFPILANIEVIAPLLIILRVANRSVFSGDVIVFASASSIYPKSQRGRTSGDESLPDGYPPSCTGGHHNGCGGTAAEVAKTIEFHCDEG